MVEERTEEQKGKIWKYSDDIAALTIVFAWVVFHWFEKTMPDWTLATALGYLFGSLVKGKE